jgi:uncharacterized membrane protein HdeD (DUF308 family)
MLELDYIKKHRSLIIFEGILFVLLGILAISLPVVSTLGTTLFIGWLFVIGGIVQLYRTFRTQGSSSFIWSLVNAILNLIVGLLLVFYPLTGALSLTILLMGFFILEGLAKISWGFKLRPYTGWGWLIFSGLISLAMAALIWSGWPETAFWVIGLLVGINMLFFGITLIFLATGLSRTHLSS